MSMSQRISPLLRNLHWLRVLDRIKFRLCVLVYCRLNGTAHGVLYNSTVLEYSRPCTAPSYLAESIRWTADVQGRRHLSSSNSTTFTVPST